DGGTCQSSNFDLAGGADCTVIVRFTPTSGGAATGSLVATSVDGGASADLTGTGLAAASLAFDLPTYAFGDVTVGAFAELSATLSNDGDQAASNVLVAVNGVGYERMGGSCASSAFSLAAGDSCTVMLRFAP